MVDMVGSTATAVHYYATNRLGSVIGMVDSAGVLTDQYLYSPFGVEEPLSASGNPFRYPGRYYDGETGLYYYRSRYYDTGGRFLEPDSILYDGDLNLYAYVGGDPINNVDPLGEEERAFFQKETSLSKKLTIFAKTFAKTVAESLEFSNGKVGLDVNTSALDASISNNGDAQAMAAGIVLGTGIGVVASRGRSAPKVGAKVTKIGGRIFERVVSNAELKATQKTGLLRGGRTGTNFFTDSASLKAKRAQQRLGLDGPLRDTRIRFKIKNDIEVVGPGPAAPGSTGTAGGGREFTTTGRTEIEIIRVDRLRK